LTNPRDRPKYRADQTFAKEDAMTVLEDSEDKKRVEAALGTVREKLVDLNLEIDKLKGIIDGVPFGGSNPPRSPK
jgi:hypothetical protein